MGGTYTSKRSIRPQSDRIYIRRANLLEVQSTWGGVFDTYQETTSYRTSGADLRNMTPRRVPLYQTRDLFDFTYFKGQRYDTGHPFYTFKKETSFTYPYFSIAGRNGTRYKGALVPSRTAFGLSSGYMDPSNSDLTGLGTTAIHRTTPTNSIASVSQLLAELKREGLPKLPLFQSYSEWLRGRGWLFRSIGGEYLNVEFAWKPTINELVNILNAVTRVPKVLEQLERESGKHVRREFRFKDTETTTTEEVNISSVVVTTAHNTTDNNRLFREVTPGGSALYNNGKLIKTETEKVSSWFDGAYTYYFESGQDLLSEARRYSRLAEKLLGLKITPEVLWELAPWSWLADWFANFGDITANVSNFMSDGLVLRYGYMMQTVVRTRTLTQFGVVFESGGGSPYSVSYVTTSKKRQKATPFGFGLNPVNFTDRQWAILAALALAKAPRSLY